MASANAHKQNPKYAPMLCHSRKCGRIWIWVSEKNPIAMLDKSKKSRDLRDFGNMYVSESYGINADEAGVGEVILVNCVNRANAEVVNGIILAI